MKLNTVKNKETGYRRTKANFIAVDVETTGLSPLRGDRVIELGAVAVENGVVTREFHTLVNIDARISLDALRVHGITHDMLVGQPKPEEVFPRFHAFIGNGVLAAHNALFDVNFLRHEFSLLGLGWNNEYLCTLNLSRKRFPRLPNHRM